jgi:hypothetical protein
VSNKKIIYELRYFNLSAIDKMYISVIIWLISYFLFQFSKIHYTKMLFWVMLNCILVKTLISGEVITLIKDHNLTCVATQNSVIYISSRVPGKIHYLF